MERARQAVGDAWNGLVRRCSTSVEQVLEGRYAKMCMAGGPWQNGGGAAAGAPEPHTVEWMWENAVGKRVAPDAVRDLLQLRSTNNGTDLDDLSVKDDIAARYDELDVDGLARAAWRKLEACKVPRPVRFPNIMPRSRGESAPCIRYGRAPPLDPHEGERMWRSASVDVHSVSMTGSMGVDVNASDEDAIDGAARGDGGNDASHTHLRQWRNPGREHFSRGVRARRGGTAATMAGLDSELAETGAVGAIGRCESDVDMSVAAGCADDGMLVGAGAYNAWGGCATAAAERRTGAGTGAVPETDGPPGVASGSMSAVTHAEGERRCFRYASSEPDVTRTFVSEIDDVDSARRESGCEAATEWCTDAVTGAVPGAQGSPVDGGGSAGAETHAGGGRHLFWHASSRSDVTRTIRSETGDVDSTENVG